MLARKVLHTCCEKIAVTYLVHCQIDRISCDFGLYKNNKTLCKTPKFHLIFECGHFVETHRPKLYGNCGFPQIFNTRKLGEIAVF